MPSPSAVVERNHVLLGDDSAQQAGIGRGTGIAAARMLAPAITLIARNPTQEQAALNALACWAGCLSPRISLAADTLLLEVGGCLRLFGGIEKMIAIASDGIREQKFSVRIAAAPTPLAAHWLARMADGTRCLDLDSMQRHLVQLPVEVLPEKTVTALARFGVTTLGELRRLNSADLGRRLGKETPLLIARAFGELPDPRTEFVFPEHFSTSLQLPAAVENAAGLLFAARRLTSALAGWLHARQAGVHEITLQLRHRVAETPLVLQFAGLTASAERFERLLRERLDKLTLSAPVESLVLDVNNIAALAPRNQSLFNEASAANETIDALLERFSAKLGEEQVYRLSAQDDHRPERATNPVPLPVKTAASQARPLPRPLWLLNEPEALSEVDGRPYRQGTLTLLAGPERIESGWWDGGESHAGLVGDIRRDYFIALSNNACWLWIFRECRAPGGWFLHGFFS